MIHTRICERVWPGAMSRAQRNQFIERWAGRDWAVRQNAAEIGKAVAAARAAGDVDNASLSFGQDAGLIDSIKSVRQVVEDIVAEAEEIMKSRLPGSCGKVMCCPFSGWCVIYSRGSGLTPSDAHL